MRSNLGLDPFEDDVGGRNHHNFPGVGIEGIFARQERIAPYTAAARAHQLAMAVIQPGKIFTDLTCIRHHHAHESNFDNRLVDHFHGREEPVEVISTFHQNLQLASAQTIGVHEAIWHLEVVVISQWIGHVGANNRRDDIAGWQRRSVMHGHNPDQVVRVLDHHRREALAFFDNRGHVLDHHLVVPAERQVIDLFFGNNDKLRQVDRECTFTQDLTLRTTLTAMSQKVGHILKIMRGSIGSQHLHRAQRFAIPCKNIADFALSDGDQWFNVHPVLDGHQEVQTTAEHVGLIARFPIQGDKARFERATSEAFFHDSDAVVGYEADAGKRNQHHKHAHDERY